MRENKIQKIYVIPVILVVLGLGVFVFSSEAQAAGNTHYVSPTGSGTVCSDANPCTMRYGVNTKAQAGDTVIFKNGTYNRSNEHSPGYLLYVTHGGDPGLPISLQSETKWGAIFNGENFGEECITLSSSAGYVTIKDFEIKNCTVGVINSANASNVSVIGNHIHHLSHHGVDLGSTNNYWTIDSNVIHDLKETYPPGIPEWNPYGIYVAYDSSHTTITNNLFYDILDGYSIHLYYHQAVNPQQDTRIINNTFADSGPDFNGQIIIAAYSPNLLIENNIFYNPTTAAIRSYANNSGRNVIIRNNLTNSSQICYDSGVPAYCAGLNFSGNKTGADPLFENIIPPDYRIRYESPAKDAGYDASDIITADIEGTSRPQNGVYDIGVYEYVSGPDKYYASPNGTGNGLTESSPFKVADFWAVAKPGNTLYLLDGIYRGDKSMISPTYDYNNTTRTCVSYKGGEENKPITVKALHDGKVTIDGQGARRPVHLLCQKYIIIEGVNAHDSSGSVFTITKSDNNIIRRSVGWDAYDGNQSIFGISVSEDNLLEDVAGFGIARKTFSSSQSGNRTTIRRSWGSWDGSHEVGPKMTYTMAYNNYDMTCENCIGTWTGSRMMKDYALKHENNGCYTLWNASQCASSGGVLQYSPEYGKDCCVFTNYGISQPYAVIGIDGFQTEYGFSNVANSRVLGSIAYVKPGNNYHVPIGQAYLVTKMNSFEYKDNAAYVENSSRKTFLLSTLQGGGGTNLFASNLTGVGGSGLQIHTDWQKSNIQEGPDIASVESIFTSPNGARLCKRYQDRVLTNEPLWPWPMNQRIIDATTLAGREVVDVTETIEELFGTIPDECKEGGFASADVDGSGGVNIKDIQICIKVITKSDLTYEAKCQAVALPEAVVNIKDIQAIVSAIVNQ